MRQTELHFYNFFSLVDFVLLLFLLLFHRGRALFGKHALKMSSFLLEISARKMGKNFNNWPVLGSTEPVWFVCVIFVNNNLKATAHMLVFQHRDSHFTQEPLYHDFVLFISTLQSEAL